MSEALIKAMRKARESTVDVEGFRFFIRRPTDWEAVSAFTNGTVFDALTDYVIGWENVKESDIHRGTTDDPAEFSRELWREWAADRTDFWKPIYKAVQDAYVAHQKKQKDLAKN